MKIWSYIESRHEDFGTALFVLPVMLVGVVVAGAAYGVTLLLFG